MTNTTKLYADGIFVSESEELIKDIKMVAEAEKHLSEEQSNELYKQFRNKIREAFGIEGVIGTVLSEDETEVYIPYFAIQPTDKNSYTLKWNLEDGFFIELEQHPTLEVIDLEIEECKEDIELAVDFEDAKESVEKLSRLIKLREATVSCLELMDEVEDFAKKMFATIPYITCPNVLK